MRLDDARKNKVRRKAPWTDFTGNAIYEGDVILHPSCERGVVFCAPWEERDTDKWRVFYENGTYVIRLCLQVGNKGMAIVSSPEEAQENK